MEALSDPRRVRTDVDVAVAARDGAEGGEDLAVLVLAFRVEVDAELDVVGDLFAGGRVVDVPQDLGSGSISFPLFGRASSPCFPTAHSHEESRTDLSGVCTGCGADAWLTRSRLVLYQSRDGVMRYATALDRPRPDLDGANPARLGQSRLDSRLVPRILRDSRHGERRRSHDEIGWPKPIGESPHVLVGKFLRRRHVPWIAFRCAGIHPSRDQVDLLVGERPVVLEMLDPDRPINAMAASVERRRAL